MASGYTQHKTIAMGGALFTGKDMVAGKGKGDFGITSCCGKPPIKHPDRMHMCDPMPDSQRTAPVRGSGMGNQANPDHGPHNWR